MAETTATATRERLVLRARTLAAVRAFFDGRGSVEVETPLLLRAPAPERNIVALRVEGDRWLAASPELQMKRLVAAGSGPIHQLGRSFRGGELGRHHNPEFTIVEWYRPGVDYRALMDETEALVRFVAGRVPTPSGARRRPRLDLSQPFERLRVADLFERFAGWRPGGDVDDDSFCRALVDRVEPALPPDRGVLVFDYPASQASLARLCPDDPELAERFELYLGGLEVANGFTELSDAGEQRARFEKERAAIAAQGRAPYPLDERFLESLPDLGTCAGVALGLDRLLMALTGSDDLGEVTALRWDEA
ncbi:MAG: EF-P lysine aminoacylase GenX [Deltaproteobacteria bacterium]|nr:EF-P lysine aminoacylase GenX [Deltaproteobacteria bacterium]